MNFRERPSSPEAVGTQPRSVAAADLDGDGDQDLAVANELTEDVTILRNNGAGGFSEHPSSPEPVGGEPRSIVVADLDADADQDLATANERSNNVTILRNNGTGSFSEHPSSPEPVGTLPLEVAAADLDDDGDQDLAVANLETDNVTILRNNGSGSFNEHPSSPEPAGNAPGSVAASDLDADGDQDLAVADRGSNVVTILRNNGSGSFAEHPSSPEPTGNLPHQLVASDLDGDGDQDLAIVTFTADELMVLRNNGSGSFNEHPASPVPVGNGPSGVAAADLDGDGAQDLAVANVFNDRVTILRNNGTGGFVKRRSLGSSGDGPNSVAAVDLDGDGDRDLAVPNLLSDDVTILVNK